MLSLIKITLLIFPGHEVEGLPLHILDLFLPLPCCGVDML